MQPTRRTRAAPTTSAVDLDAELDRLDSERLVASLASVKPWHPTHALSDLPRDVVYRRWNELTAQLREIASCLHDEHEWSAHSYASTCRKIDEAASVIWEASHGRSRLR